jgi:serine/threonine protein kinase
MRVVCSDDPDTLFVSHLESWIVSVLLERYMALCSGERIPPDLRALLSGHPEASFEERLEVVLVDQRRRWLAGIGWQVEDYLSNLPEIARDPRVRNRLIEGEERIVAEINRRAEDARSRGSTAGADVVTVESLQPHESLATAQENQSIGITSGPELDLTAAPTDAPSTHQHQPPLSLSIGEPVTYVAPAEIESDGRFQILSKLGDGGMGIVYRALDRHRGETVALKTMKKVDPLSLFRFKQEFRSLADLSHPNLISLYELISAHGHWFFTMELLTGTDFLTYVRHDMKRAKSPTVDADQATTDWYEFDGDPLLKGPTRSTLLRLRHVFAQLVAGVKALHEAGKLHRDIKPSNVMVTDAGRLVLMDFGLVTDVNPLALSLEPDRAVVGTIAYISPEQAAGRPATVASDWYSVGVMIYGALTGLLPFDGPAATVLRRKQVVDPSPPLAFCSDIPHDLNELCVSLLARDPDKRPGGQEILERLGQGMTEPDLGRETKASRTATLVGRESHRQAFDAAYRTMLAGKPMMLLVKGRSGSGKSALVQSILESLEERGEAVVLSGRCYERESVPYKALDNLIDDLTRYLIGLLDDTVSTMLPRDIEPLTRVFPVLLQVQAVAEAARRSRASPPDRQELRRRAFAGLRELFRRVGDRSPLVLAIDDLQWGDVDSGTPGRGPCTS